MFCDPRSEPCRCAEDYAMAPEHQTLCKRNERFDISACPVGKDQDFAVGYHKA